MVRSKNHSHSDHSRSHSHHHAHRHHQDKEVMKKKRRNKPGKVTEREIKFYQASTFLLLRKTPFYR